MVYASLWCFVVFTLFSTYSCDNCTGSDNLLTCEYNPDEFLNTPQIIRRYGYRAESHIIQTDDGYLLTLYRIPYSRDGQRGEQPIILQHGLLSSSDDWVDRGNTSLAFLLADNGYDVWLGNARGNVYSRAHVSLSTSSAKFWNFSWHEMATHDLPAVISFISNTTMRNDLLYVGHSMGTTMFFVMAATLPEVADNIKTMVALAPVAYMTHVKSPIRYLKYWVNDLEFLRKHIGLNEFLPSSKILQMLSYGCVKEYTDEICENIIFLLTGFDKKEFDPNLLQVVLHHAPAGTSSKTVLHYLQEIAYDGNFQMYDYGKDGNMNMYGQPTPPQYPLERIEVPTYLMYADNDWLASPIDVKRLADNLPKNIGLWEVGMPVFNHIDFLFGIHAPQLVYEPLIEFLRQYNNKTIPK